jgi:hypothetical protein
VTTPADDTVAIDGVLELHATGLPVTTLLFASRSVAESVTVPLTVTDAELGATLTVATGGRMTVTCAVPVWPSLEAVIVTGPPTATAVTSPCAETAANAELDDDHATTRSVSAAPRASRTAAASWTEPPCATVLIPGVTATAATDARVIVICAVALCPSTVAVIVTGPPTETPVTKPDADTAATVALADAHCIVRPVSAVPAASFGVAVS